MRKFLLPLLLVFAILIPAIQAQAADVPNFRRVAGDIVKGGKQFNEEGYHVYKYNILTYDDSLEKSFTEQYVRLLQENGLTLVDHKEETESQWSTPDFWLEGAWCASDYHGDWFFDCKGHQVLFSLDCYAMTYGGKNPSRKSHMFFSVKVANGLTYEED